uniref:Uncharacterized protein n=1 Tax=Raphanus sativus TaxID=3726 RepID=A0A650GBL0_RAPSA|nr:hypothetical protein [Raphanus sativus]
MIPVDCMRIPALRRVGELRQEGRVMLTNAKERACKQQQKSSSLRNLLTLVSLAILWSLLLASEKRIVSFGRPQTGRNRQEIKHKSRGQMERDTA